MIHQFNNKNFKQKSVCKVSTAFTLEVTFKDEFCARKLRKKVFQ